MIKPVFLTLGALSASASCSVRADALLFPVLTRSPTVATIVSIVNTDPDGVLNVNYFTKSDDPSIPCTDNGVRQITNTGRPNDLVSFDASGNFLAGSGGPLFNDPATLATYGAVDFTMEGSGVSRAVLVVDDGDDTIDNGDPNSSSDLYGEAILLEIDGGAAFGYRAYNSLFDLGPSGPVFGNAGDALGEVIEPGIGELGVGTTFLPPDEWTTRFFITPVAGSGTAASQRDCENCSANIFIAPDKSGTRAGLYDRDTVLRADPPFAPAALPAVAKNVVCTGAYGLTDLIPQAVANQISSQGGWGYVQIRPGTSGNMEGGAVVLKLEFNLTASGATSMVSPDTARMFTGTVNNGVWLRNAFDQPGVSGF